MSINARLNVLAQKLKCVTSSRRHIRIGCASGFWGDTPIAVPQLIHQGNVDFIVFDYLAEITMSLLAASKQKNPELGYTPDFILYGIGPHLSDLKRKGIRVVSNAGGVNPIACADALKKATIKAGVDLKIAVITGDDLMNQKDRVQSAGVTEMKSKRPFPSTLHTMNAYLGAGPIRKALDLGAEVVITGRCVDSAIVLGPLMHTFNWEFNDYNKLAAGSLAGHLVECGAQSTGGIFTDWHLIDDWSSIGFPIVDVKSDGHFLLTKPENTGGLISCATVAEQLVYEIDDPERYLLPDVTCDFSDVLLGETPAGVSVAGVKGKMPSPTYKVCATYMDGYRLVVVATMAGPKAADKAQKTANALLARCSKLFSLLGKEDFKKTEVQIIGTETASYGSQASPATKETREVALWMGVHHDDLEALRIFSREISSAGTGMAPGTCSIVGGRPKPSPLLKLYSFLYPKTEFKPKVIINEEEHPYEEPQLTASKLIPQKVDGFTNIIANKYLVDGKYLLKLSEFAYTRSGDKGDSSNIGVICRHPSYFECLKKHLTAELVENYFKHVFEGDLPEGTQRVRRYELPGIHALNFVLENSLGGGGMASLRYDPQGKAYGQILLDLVLNGVPNLVEMVRIYEDKSGLLIDLIPKKPKSVR